MGQKSNFLTFTEKGLEKDTSPACHVPKETCSVMGKNVQEILRDASLACDTAKVTCPDFFGCRKFYRKFSPVLYRKRYEIQPCPVKDVGLTYM